MSIQVEMIADSRSASEVRLTTLRMRYPRFILAEVNTHRALSKSTSSSRAIPIETMVEMVLSDPAYPDWTLNQRGMQGREPGPDWDLALAKAIWLDHRDAAVKAAQKLARNRCSKEVANRLLEPFAHVTTVATADEFGWANLFHLRTHADANPTFRRLAIAGAVSIRDSTPVDRPAEGWHDHIRWHLPFVTDEEREQFPVNRLLKVSAARCARTSYTTHEGKVATFDEDADLYDRLAGHDPMHASPLEHQAASGGGTATPGNFVGWHQHRKMLPNECKREFDYSTLAAMEGKP